MTNNTLAEALEPVEAMRQACIAAVRAEQKYEGSDFPVCNAIVRAIEEIPARAASDVPVPDDAQRRDDIRRSIIRQLGDDPHADRIILPGTDWDIVLATLRASTDAAEERDALLSALGWKTGPFRDEGVRTVILEDSAGLRPAMVEARREAQDASGDRDMWRWIAGERVEDARSGLLLRVWNQMKDERRRRIKAEAELAHPPADAAAVAGEGLTIADAWQDLVDKDDRTSPEEYPDMALITREELADYMEASHPAPAEPVGLREAIKTLEVIRDTDAPASFLREAAATTLSTLTRTDEAQS